MPPIPIKLIRDQKYITNKFTGEEALVPSPTKITGEGALVLSPTKLLERGIGSPPPTKLLERGALGAEPPTPKMNFLNNINMDDEMLRKFQQGLITIDEFKKELAIASKKQVQFKVTEKGCVGIYGIRKFPITLYKNELETMLNAMVEPGFKYSSGFEEFLTKNEALLNTK